MLPKRRFWKEEQKMKSIASCFLNMSDPSTEVGRTLVSWPEKITRCISHIDQPNRIGRDVRYSVLYSVCRVRAAARGGRTPASSAYADPRPSAARRSIAARRRWKGRRGRLGRPESRVRTCEYEKCLQRLLPTYFSTVQNLRLGSINIQAHS